MKSFDSIKSWHGGGVGISAEMVGGQRPGDAAAQEAAEQWLRDHLKEGLIFDNDHVCRWKVVTGEDRSRDACIRMYGRDWGEAGGLVCVQGVYGGCGSVDADWEARFPNARPGFGQG